MTDAAPGSSGTPEGSGTPAVAVVLVAAGAGSRFGAGVPKAFARLGDRTLLGWSLATVCAWSGASAVVVVAPPSHLDEAAEEAGHHGGGVRVVVVPGGAQRSDSVGAGVAALPEDVGVVLVHDAARPLAPAELFGSVTAAVAAGHPAVVPGLPVVDTIKQVDASGTVVATLPRTSLRAVQTPQGFRREVLEEAHTVGDTSVVTDDAALVEALGYPVLVVPGHPLAYKITTVHDLDQAEASLRALAAADGAPP